MRPGTERFRANVDEFDRVCQVTNGVKGMIVGAIGARTTPFKTVRIDEVALQRHGVTVETFDMSDVFQRMRAVKPAEVGYTDRAAQLRGVATWDGVPERAFENIVRLSVSLDQMIKEANLDAVAIRCWTEIQTQMGISPCVTMGSLDDFGIGSGLRGRPGQRRGDESPEPGLVPAGGLLDWNNNYYDEDDKCILFHCGVMPAGLMEGKGHITDHSILMNSVGEGNGYGCNQGRIKPMDFTFSSLMTDEGRIKMYMGEGRFTTDPIPANFLV